MSVEVCLKCGDTGLLVNGEPCDCGCKQEMTLPTCMNIPMQYQGVRFDSSLLPSELRLDYGHYMDKLLKDCTQHLDAFKKNVLICSPPNSGKTIFAYTVYGLLFARGLVIPDLMDIMEVRDILMSYYNQDFNQIEIISKGKIAFIKIPQDLPNKFAETISTIVERRVRNNCVTIFLYSGTSDDLLAQDRFGKFKAMLGDGSYNSIEIQSWKLKD